MASGGLRIQKTIKEDLIKANVLLTKAEDSALIDKNWGRTSKYIDKANNILRKYIRS